MTTASMLSPDEIHPKRKVVYVAGPFSGNTIANIHAACITGDALLHVGLTPIVPHSFQTWDLVSPKSYEEWMHICLDLVSVAHMVLRMPGESAGADREVAHAQSLKIPVYQFVEDCVEFARHGLRLVDVED